MSRNAPLDSGLRRNDDIRSELRGIKPTEIKKVVIYASSPISKVVGEFEIEDILSLKLSELWKRTMEHSGIDKDFYDSYFSGKDIGHAIKVKSAKRYKRHKELKEFDINYAPQSFAYI